MTTADPGDPARPTTRVVVAMATFRRPDDLARAIPPLLAQCGDLAGATARLLVVDNDPEGGARDTVAPWLSEHAASAPVAARPAPFTYVHEPVPGIAAARNRALAEAADAEAIVFIDDDETPDDGWLQHLVDAWREWGCAAVTGPVTFWFDGDADEWVRASGVFTRQERPTGSVTRGASSANLLLDLRVLHRLDLRFDDAFGISGGSDTMLAHTLGDRGEQIRWCQEAGVSERVPASRARRDWVFKRTMRTSNSVSRSRLALATTPSRRVRTTGYLVAVGGYRLVRGSANRLVARVRGEQARDARGAVDQASGLGVLMGAAGVVRYEYRRTGAGATGREAGAGTPTGGTAAGRVDGASGDGRVPATRRRRRRSRSAADIRTRQ